MHHGLMGDIHQHVPGAGELPIPIAWATTKLEKRWHTQPPWRIYEHVLEMH